MPRSSRRGMGRTTIVALTLGALAVGTIAPVAEAAKPKNKRASVKTNGAQVLAHSAAADITPDGRFIAFSSESDDLSGKDRNKFRDVYVRDMKNKKTRLVSVSGNGADGDGSSFQPAISANGRYVVFHTSAKNLFGNDGNKARDVVIHDRWKKTTRLISKSTSGAKGDAESIHADITPDGRFVVFESIASNLVGGDTMGNYHIYIHDRKKKTTRLVSKGSGGRADANSSKPSVSANGRFIAFDSDADNLVDDDDNGVTDVFVHDRKKNRTWRVSERSNGAQVPHVSRDARISADGKIVAFVSDAEFIANDTGSETSDVFVHNRGTKRTRQVSVSSNGVKGDGESGGASISPDGRFVGFDSGSDNLVNGVSLPFSAVFIHDRKKKRTKFVSKTRNGADPDGTSRDPSVSANGRFVAFQSAAENLIGSDSNARTDIFRRGPLR